MHASYTCDENKIGKPALEKSTALGVRIDIESWNMRPDRQQPVENTINVLESLVVRDRES